MRRFLLWYLPLSAALIGLVLFSYGLSGFVRGDLGEPIAARYAASPTAPVKAGELRVLVLGDSLARGTGDVSGLGIGGNLDAELTKRGRKKSAPINVAVNGARTGDLIEQLRHANVRKLIAESSVIIVSIGGNDLFGDAETRSNPPADPDRVIGRVLDNVEAAIKRIRESNPNARVFLIGLYNPFVGSDYGKLVTGFVNRWNSEVIRRFQSDPNFTLVQTADLFSHSDRLSMDRFHPGEEAYRLMARRIAESL